LWDYEIESTIDAPLYLNGNCLAKENLVARLLATTECLKLVWKNVS